MTQVKEDLTGFANGRIVVVRRTERPSHLRQRGTYWVYRCKCGNEGIAHRTTIVRTLRSCGCIGREKKYAVKSTIHYRRLYHIWHSMLDRCNRPGCVDYKNYGGRGIKVAASWHDFGTFYNDMIDSYQAGLTLERIDVDGDYCPQNCTWITNAAQASNRRTSLSYREQKSRT